MFSSPLCADCLREEEEEPTPGAWLCTETKCALRALCDGHAVVHRTRKHPIIVLPADDGLPADALLGVTQCPRPDHAGAEGRITHLCTKCGDAECLRCAVDIHVAKGHPVVPMTVAGGDARGNLQRARPELAAGLAFQQGLTARCRKELEELVASRAVALEALHRQHAALVAQLARQRDEVAAAIEIQWRCKSEAVTKVLMCTRCAVGHLGTVAAAAQLAVEGTDDVLAVHVDRAAAGCQRLVADRDPHFVDVTLDLHRDPRPAVFPLGILVTQAVDADKCTLAWGEVGTMGSPDKDRCAPLGKRTGGAGCVRLACHAIVLPARALNHAARANAGTTFCFLFMQYSALCVLSTCAAGKVCSAPALARTHMCTPPFHSGSPGLPQRWSGSGCPLWRVGVLSTTPSRPGADIRGPGPLP